MLKPGGRAVLPIGLADQPQKLCAVDKGFDGTTVETRETINVMYVPLTSVDEQQKRAQVRACGWLVGWLGRWDVVPPPNARAISLL